MKIFDEVLHYGSRYIDDRCHLAVYDRLGSRVAVMVEVGREEAPTMSVTNACEQIATEAVKATGVNPGRVIWIEHYPADEHRKKETFSLVTFLWSWNGIWTASSPRWAHVTREWVEELIKEPFGGGD